MTQPDPTNEDTTIAELDQSALDNIRALQREGKPSILAKIIGIYLDSSPALVDELNAAVQRGDLKGLQHAAHSLKSSSANLGAVAIFEICRELERCARENSIENAAPMLTSLESQFAAACRALHRELDKQAA